MVTTNETFINSKNPRTASRLINKKGEPNNWPTHEQVTPAFVAIITNYLARLDYRGRSLFFIIIRYYIEVLNYAQ